jgi:AcrR family transcriptional regulator
MEIRTENKIFDAAYHTFLLYGFHGTTIQKIALKADVSKSSIHYYFRSKEKLYVLVVRSILDTIQETESEISLNREKDGGKRWFLSTELYNNRTILEQAIHELFPNDWNEKLIY